MLNIFFFLKKKKESYMLIETRDATNENNVFFFDFKIPNKPK